MSKYGNGISYQDAKYLDREEIEQALKGLIRVGEDENGFIYEPGTKEQCDKVILDNYDDVVYQSLECNRHSRVVEALIKAPIQTSDDYLILARKERLKDYDGIYYTEILNTGKNN